MSKYPYSFTRIEKDGRRDFNFVKVLSPTSFIEMSDGYSTVSIYKQDTTKGTTTDSLFKEKGRDGKLVLMRNYVPISEDVWNQRFLQVVNRLGAGKKYKELSEENTPVDLKEFFTNFEKAIESVAQTTMSAQLSLIKKYKSKILEE